jgi:hypothetical protein
MAPLSAAAIYMTASYVARVESSPEIACTLFEESIFRIDNNVIAEGARQSYAHFLMTLPVPPFARLLHHVTSSIALYPNNTLFLSLLVYLKRQGRDILDIMSKLEQAGDKTIINGLWAPCAIAAIGGDAFWKHGSAERERVRVLLDRIVSDEKYVCAG